MATKRYALWFVFCLVLGCAAASDPSEKRAQRAPQVAQAPNANPPVPDGPAVPVERKIIYTSQIEVIVDDLKVAQQRLEELVQPVQQAGGYVARQEINGRTGYHRQSSWTIRVPLSKFDGFVAEVEKLGELQRNSRDAQDVTEAYADLDARLRNKQASEARLLSHLEKTGDLKDTLEIERELSRVRGEIEQLQGQLSLLKNKTDLATVTLTLHERENYTPPSTPDFSTQISRTFAESWKGMLLLGKGLALIGVGASPWLIATGILLFPVWIVRRRRPKSH